MDQNSAALVILVSCVGLIVAWFLDARVGRYP